MKTRCLFIAVALLTGMAVGQFKSPYVIKNIKSTTTDITARTNTVNAWKQFGSGCRAKTITSGTTYRACIMNDGYVYAFNLTTKTWDKQTAMGLGVVQLAAADPATVFALMSAPQCTGQYGLFLWTGSAWSQKGGCYTQIAAGTNESTVLLAGINNINQMWFSNDEGNTWTIQSNSWLSASLGLDGMGCAVDTAHNMWSITNGQLNGNVQAIPSPNGSVVGCLWAVQPTVAMAWTSTGWVYSMPLENFGTWQVVAGIAAQRIVGNGRFYIFAEDTGFKIYHWNVNAPTVSANYGGVWNPSQGCPVPTSQCNSNAQHTLKLTVHFTSGHGIGGHQNIATQPFSSDIETLSSDTNPGCDSLVGADGECKAEATASAECDQSMANVGNDGFQVLGIFESVDDETWTGNIPGESNTAPFLLAGTPEDGIWAAESYNHITNACPILTQSTCPLEDPMHEAFYQAFAGTEESTIVYNSVLGRLGAANTGIDAPYTYRDAYMQIQPNNPNLPPFNSCLSVDNEPGQYWWTVYFALPDCK